MKFKLISLIALLAVLLLLAGCSLFTPKSDVTFTPNPATVEAIIAATSAAQQPVQQPTQQIPQITETAPGDISQPEPPPGSSGSESGSISGTIIYPATPYPAMRVVAFNQETATWYAVETKAGQMTYKLDNVPVGRYVVVAYILPGAGKTQLDFSGGYSQAVICGLGDECTDHSPVIVAVLTNQETVNVNPGDWYAPAGTYPKDPTLP